MFSLRKQIEAKEEQRRINGGEEGGREEREVMDAAACLPSPSRENTCSPSKL